MIKSKLMKSMFFSLALALFLVGCKKESSGLTTVNFHLLNVATGEAYAGVKVKIIERKEVRPSPLNFETQYKPAVIWEGVTDADGKASHSFKTYKHFTWSYWASVD